METIKKVIDAVAVMVGNLLNLNPTGWTESKKQAEEMRAMYANPAGVLVVDAKLYDGNEEVKPVRSMSPVRYMFDRLLTAVAGVAVLYIAIKFFITALMVCLALVAFALVLFALTKIADFFFGSAKEVNTATPAAA